MYSFDTIVFMDWQARYYPPDIFISLVAKIEELIVAGQCSAIELVKEEIDAVGTPELRAWVKRHPALFVTLDPLVQVEAASIESKYPDLMDPKSLHQSADAYVVALAKLRERTHYIPADSLLYYFRISYYPTVGHRGFFHSPFLGLIVSFLLMLLFFRDEPLFSGRWFRYFFLFFLVWMSHGLLDALTNGGRGVAFFSPFSSKRYFLPWTPIQVSPMRIKSFFTPWGWSVFKSELVWIWLPGVILVSLSRMIRFWTRN